MKKVVFLKIFILLSFANFGQSVDLTSYLPKNFVRNGSKDYTNYLQIGLNLNSNVTLPDFPVLINETGLYLKSNQILNFDAKSSLIMKPNYKSNYGILNIINVSNVKVNNANLIGDREKHKNSIGEWGMGINILSSSNISIINPIVSECWGDGIYIGEINSKDKNKFKIKDYFSKNIRIEGGVLNRNRRNGISIISVKGIVIKGTVIKNTNGTMPMAGIDLEPNSSSQFLENILIENVTTINNGDVGIKYVPLNFYGNKDQNVSISIINCRDEGSNGGITIGGVGATNRYKVRKLSGKISIKNFSSNNNKFPIRSGSIQKYNPNINIESFKIYDKNIRSTKKEQEQKLELKKRGIRLSIN